METHRRLHLGRNKIVALWLVSLVLHGAVLTILLGVAYEQRLKHAADFPLCGIAVWVVPIAHLLVMTLPAFFPARRNDRGEAVDRSSWPSLLVISLSVASACSVLTFFALRPWLQRVLLLG